MKATLLGSGTILPSVRRGSPGILVEGDGFTLLVDAGPGTGARLARAGVSLADLDGILITHFHPDHVADLIPLLFALRNPCFAGVGWPTLVGPVGFREFYRGLRTPFEGWIPADGQEIPLREVPGGGESCPGEEIGGTGYRLTAQHVEHTDNSLAYRVTDAAGRVVVCSGDTSECPAIVQIARDADLLFLECAFPNGQGVPGHLDPDAVTRIVEASGARQVVLTHFYPECDEVDLVEQLGEKVRSRVRLGEDGESYECFER